MDPKEHSFLFIPDITGFTEFVNRTEVEHSQHIISELLEAIIDSNILDLEVSEVEGDAVLFYKRKAVPELPQVLEQSRQMFANFHAIIRRYENQRICNCGACSTAVDLKLKFVAHSGELGFTKIKGVEKPHGYDVVLIHKLLKNNVQLKEYLLWTETSKFNSTAEELTRMASWIELCHGSVDFEKVGRVNISYVPLNPLHFELANESVESVKRSANPVVSETFVARDPHFVFQYVIRLDLRKEWNEGLKDIKYDDPINKIGSKHICVLDSGTLEIETVTDGHPSSDTMVYGERILNPPFPFKSLMSFFNISARDGGTMVRLEMDYAIIPLLSWLSPLIRIAAKKKASSLTGGLKEAVELYQGGFP